MNKRQKSFLLRLTEAEHKKLLKEANKAGKSLNQHLLDQVLVPGPLDEIFKALKRIEGKLNGNK